MENKIKIWGALLVSREGGLLNVVIPSLMKYCNNLLIVMDNEDECTKRIVLEYQNKYSNIIKVGFSGILRATELQENEKRGLFKRFKPLQGVVRDTVIQQFHELAKNGEKIDIIIWPDGDEVLTVETPRVIENFLERSDKIAVITRPITVFGDMQTITECAMAGHARMFRLVSTLTAVPKRSYCRHFPITRENALSPKWKFIAHLATATREKIAWRYSHWTTGLPPLNAPLWRLKKNVMQLTQEELDATFLEKPRTTVGEYLKNNNIIQCGQ